MEKDSGQLSLDFIIGFAIFLIGFIFVATMISGLLVGLQSKTIDYDAVAYRTGVILAEDPGWVNASDPFNWQWVTNKSSIERIGLSISRSYPNTLLQTKADKFFNYSTNEIPSNFYFSGSRSPDDYTNKTMLKGDYIYEFNISMKNITPDYSYTRNIGNRAPPNHGYIRRIVMIKRPNASAIIPLFSGVDSTNISTISFVKNSLLNKEPIYQINRSEDQLTINLTNISTITLEQIWMEDDIYNINFSVEPDSPTIHVWNGTSFLDLSKNNTITNNTQIIIDKGYFDRIESGPTDLKGYPFSLRMRFNNSSAGSSIPVDYSLVARPEIFTAVMEVRIW
jgi:hypothetical protein